MKLLLQGYRWVLRCLIRCEFWLNFFPHSWHVKGFSPVWVLWCVWRCEFWLKLFPHHEHLYGFIPWCVVRCLLRSELHLNLLSHCWHLYGFSSVWILWCLIRSELTLKLFPHSWHLKAFSPARSFLWRSISFSSSCFQVESFFFFFTGKSRFHFPTLCISPWFSLVTVFWGTFNLAFLDAIATDACISKSERHTGWWFSVSFLSFSPAAGSSSELSLNSRDLWTHGSSPCSRQAITLGLGNTNNATEMTVS